MKPGRSFLVVVVLVLIAALPLVAGKKNKKADKDKAESGSSVEVADVAAWVGDEPVTLETVDQAILGRLVKLRQDEYNLRRTAVDQIVGDMLIENEAARRGVTVEELEQTEVVEKATPPTEQQIAQYYNAYKSRNRQLQNMTLEQATPMIRQTLDRNQVAIRRLEFIDELKAETDVRIALDPPRAELTIPEGAPTKGPEDAPVTMVMYSDYQCPYCKRAQPIVDGVLETYGDKIRFVYLEFPLAFHQRATPASMAALCAGAQDRYWEYHDSLLGVNGNLSDEDLTKRAQNLELDMEQFTACYDGGEYESYVKETMDAASALGVTGTPTFFLNGRMMVGAKPLDQFKELIDEELDLAEARTGS